MGRIPSNTPSQSIIKRGLKFMTPFHKEIARRLVLGERQCAIAREFGINQSRLSIIVNSSIFKAVVEKLDMERDKLILKSPLE
jgi:hypothetical protein